MQFGLWRLCYCFSNTLSHPSSASQKQPAQQQEPETATPAATARDSQPRSASQKQAPQNFDPETATPAARARNSHPSRARFRDRNPSSVSQKQPPQKREPETASPAALARNSHPRNESQKQPPQQRGPETPTPQVELETISFDGCNRVCTHRPYPRPWFPRTTPTRVVLEHPKNARKPKPKH